MERRTLLTLATVTAAAAVTGLSGCSSTDEAKPQTTPTTTTPSTTAAKPMIATSTTAWALVAQAIAGDDATVTSIITRPDADPHDFEPAAKDKLTVSQSTIFVVNGGGYDDWATQLVESLSTKPSVVNAVSSSGLEGAGTEGFNEHVWYSMAAVSRIGTAIAEVLAQTTPSKAATFRQRAAAFSKEVQSLGEQISSTGKKLAKKPTVVATEPVGHYLIENYGYRDITPEEFVTQSEAGSGVSATVLNQMTTMLKNGQATALLANPQTEDATTDALVAAANSSKTPVAWIRETPPTEVHDFKAFILQAVQAIDKAVSP